MSRQPDRHAISEKRRPPPAWQKLAGPGGDPMRITLVSIHVEDQDRALAFYRDVLGFVP